MIAAVAALSLLFGLRGSDAPQTGPDAPEPVVVLSDTVPARGVPAEVTAFLRNGQWWRAARRMREFLQGNPDASPEAILLAARAEAEWGGWDRARRYLEGRPWLDQVQGGEGWYWLGRAREQDQAWEPALEAYTRYLAAGPDGAAEDRRRVAQLRRGLVLLRLGRVDEGSAVLEGMRSQAPAVSPWVSLLAAEALATRGDTARVRDLVRSVEIPGSAQRERRALLAAYEQAGDSAGARNLAVSLRGAAGNATDRAELSARAGRLALATGDAALALRELRSAVAGAPGSAGARQAASLLARLPGLTAGDRLAIATVQDRHGDNRAAAAGYRAWLAAGAGSAGERAQIRLRLGRALFDAGDYAAAETELRPLAQESGDAAAEAMHLVGRAQYRRGERQRALDTFLRLAERFPGSEAGSEGLFLVADLSHDAGQVARAGQLYRRVASEFRGRDRAGLSLMRLAGIEFLERDYAAAAKAWEEYRSSYPTGERWLQSTYWAGRAYEAAGDTAAARARYRAVRERDPLSYYALRAGERLDQPFWPVALAASPPENAAARRQVEEWMRGVELLRSAGLHDEAEAEVDRLVASAGENRALLYPLGEILNERGYSQEGIRIGLRLQRLEGRQNPRMLRILYPWPYRAMIEAEARERGLDPYVVAALTRQESMFKARIASPVGARGLMQIMPPTGEKLASAADIENWDAELLYQPEINAHLGTMYLAEQMRRWNGSLPSVFSAYNAGPHRVETWQQFPEYGDEQLFTERIPYRETRDYVRILTRNIALYRGLYGEKGTE